MVYRADSPYLYMRSFIDLDPELAGELTSRAGPVPAGLDTRPLVVIADTIMLSGAEIGNRDVTLIARSIVAGVQGIAPLTLTRPGRARGGVVTDEGQVEPPRPVQGTPPEKGTAGPSLTIYCIDLSNGSFAESHGQAGGRGLPGPRETRDVCGANPDACAGLTPAQIRVLLGSPGGPGQRGADGGEPGVVRVFAVQDFAQNAPSWRGIGGAAGEGGLGGPAGAGGNGRVDPDNRGLPGPPGTQPGPRPGEIIPIDEQGFHDAVMGVDVYVDPTATERASDLWAEFKRRQAATEIRMRFIPTAAAPELDEAAALAPENADSMQLRRLLADHSAQHGVELDVDLIGTPAALQAELDHARAALDAVVAPLRPPPGDADVPGWFDPARLAPAAVALRQRLAALISADEFVVQRTAVNDRLNLARSARRAAHVNRSIAADRLGQRLDAAPAGLGLALPAAGLSLNRDGLRSLRTALLGLAPALPIDDVENPVPPAGPSGDPAVLLPQSLGLLVHTSVRDAGPYRQYPPDVPSPPAVCALADSASWPKALQAGTGDAIDLTAVAAQLRSALRPAGPVGPAAVAIAHDLAELAEAQHAWRLADLRLAQAVASAAVLTAAEAEATAALAALPAVPAGTTAEYPVYLRGLRALGDLVGWRTHRAHRAHDLYTLDLSPFDLRRPLNIEQFDPVVNADLESATAQSKTRPQSEAAKAARTLTIGLDRAAATTITTSVAQYRARGTEVTRFLAPRVFCAQPGGPGSGCETASPHVFAALQHPLSRGFWLNVDLPDVQGGHREAKIRGALVRFAYDLSGGEAPPDTHAVDLVHQGVARQRQLLADTVHPQSGLPRGSRLTLTRIGESAVWEGSIDVDSANTAGTNRFPAYGRGVAAGYRLELVDQNLSRPDLLTRIEVHIEYEARQDPNIVNLRSASLTGGLHPGIAASGTVELTGPAPQGGVAVKLRSSESAVISVPGQVVVPAGATAATFAAQVLKPTGAIPPRLTASTPDGVHRHALAVVPAAAAPVASAVSVDGDGSTFAVALGRLGPATAPRPEPSIFVTHAPVATTDEPAGDGPGNSVHAFGPNLTQRAQVASGFWPRSVDVDAARNRLYVLHGSTVSLLDATTLKTRATHEIGINATTVAVDAAAELVYVTRYSHGTVHVLRGADLSVVEVFGTHETLRGCFGIAFDPARSTVYLSRNYRIADPTATAVTKVVRGRNGSHTIERDVTVGPVSLQPQPIAVDASAGLVFVGCLGGNPVPPALLVLDAATLAERHRIPTPGGVQGVAAREGTGLAYLTAGTGLHVVDGRAGRLAWSVRAGRHPQGLALDPVTGIAYVADRLDHSLTRIETPDDVSAVTWR